jgi:acyl-coenzyme A synthetase/AMP-(fatty) acid ligase
MLTQTIYMHAQQTPNKTAVIFNDRELSYFEFASLIEVYRRLLAEQGLTGNGVALLPNGSSLNAWIAGLALRSLGLTTVVAPSVDDAARLDLPDIRCVAAVAGEHWPGLERLCDDRGWQLIGLPEPRITHVWEHGVLEMPDWPAMLGERILLTSGTTGTYKKSLFNPISEVAEPHRRLVFGISDRSLVHVPYFGGWTALGYNVPAHAWDAGGAVSLYQGSHPWEAFQRPGITHALVTPHLLAGILLAPQGELPRNNEMSLIVTAGALSQEQYEAAKARLTTEIYVSVGATEVGVYTVTRVEQPDDLRWHRIVPGCEVQVVDDEGRPLPAGEVGLIRVRVTDGATGYLFDEAATREFFHGDYFYPGDLGAFRSDGRLALHGRESDVINLFGEKVLPGPFEEQLVDQFGIAGACLLEGRREGTAERIHIILVSPRHIPQSELAAVLAKLLPGPLQAKVYYVNALPRNHMGKIRRDVLRRLIGLQ